MPPSRQAGPVTCILNIGSGSGQADAIGGQLKAVLARHGIEAGVLMAEGREISSLAERAASEGAQTIVAGGGDGTVSCVAAHLAGTEAVLGVLPLGTLNHFAKDLGIPLDLEGAVGIIAAGHVRRVDLGEVNGRVFLNNSSLGAYPQIVRQREAQQKSGHGKWVAMAKATWSVLRHPSPLHIRVAIAGQPGRARKTPLLFVGNNEYEIEGVSIGCRTQLDSGQLWACMAPQAGRGRLLRTAIRALAGRLKPSDLDALSAAEIHVTTRKSQALVATDGEVVLMPTPLRYRIRPAALRVLSPG